MERDWARDELYTTVLNPIFHIWQKANGKYYYACNFEYEEDVTQTFDTEEELMKHIHTMLDVFAKEHRLLSWSYTKVDKSFTYKEDFGEGVETYIGIFQATTAEDAPEYIRWGELIDEYIEVMKGKELC